MVGWSFSSESAAAMSKTAGLWWATLPTGTCRCDCAGIDRCCCVVGVSLWLMAPRGWVGVSGAMVRRSAVSVSGAAVSGATVVVASFEVSVACNSAVVGAHHAVGRAPRACASVPKMLSGVFRPSASALAHVRLLVVFGVRSRMFGHPSKRQARAAIQS